MKARLAFYAFCVLVANLIPKVSGFGSSCSFQRQNLLVSSPTTHHVAMSKTPSQARDAIMSKQLQARSFVKPMRSSSTDEDPMFNGQTTVALVGGQSLLIVAAVVAAQLLNVPNFGLGSGFLLDNDSIQSGVLATLPLFILAFILDFVEKSYPPLEDVSKATQRSVLGLLGGVRKPLLALGVSIALGAAAGWGEEMLFRGVLQSELGERFGDIAALTSSAVIFGALHAVTPLYAILAGMASLYFGELYLQYNNLAVPIVCHGLYDVGALMAAHFTVTAMSEDERIALTKWEPDGRE